MVEQGRTARGASAELDIVDKSRAGQGSVGQGRAEQPSANHGRAEERRTAQGLHNDVTY